MFTRLRGLGRLEECVPGKLKDLFEVNCLILDLKTRAYHLPHVYFL
jgi:hypothetical protein